MTFGERIRQCRKAAGLTQAEMADRLGCATSTIKRYELGEAKPRSVMLKAIAYEFGCTVEDLTGGEPNETEEGAKAYEDTERFGETVGRKLREQGRTVKWLSTETGIPATTLYSMIRRGSNRVDTLTALRIMEVFPDVAENGIVNELYEKVRDLKKMQEEA